MKPEDVSVVWVSEDLGGHGGSEYSTIAFTTLLSEAGATVSIVTPPGIRDAWRTLADASGVIIRETSGTCRGTIVQAVVEQCRTQCATVAHFVPWSELLLDWHCARPYGIATVATEPTSGDHSCWWLPAPERAPVDALATLTSAAQTAIKIRMQGSTPVLVIPKLLLPTRPIPTPNGPRRIGALARLSEEKGLVYLLAALSLMPAGHEDVTLHLFGEGPEQERLETLAVMLGLKDRVVLEGAYDPYFGLRAAVAGIHVAVLPSLFEGLPTALLECMALEIPVVSTRTAGAVAALGSDYDFLVDVADTRGMALAIARLLASGPTRSQAIEWGRSRLCALLNRERTLQALLALYDTAASAHLQKKPQ